MVAIENVGLSELSYIYKIGLNTDGFLRLECWGKKLREEFWDTCIVILVISCLAFVAFTLAIVIIMCSFQESGGGYHQYTILYFPSSVPSRTR